MGEGKESGIIIFSVFGIIMLLIWSEGKIIYSLFWGESLIPSPDRVGWKCWEPGMEYCYITLKDTLRSLG